MYMQIYTYMYTQISYIYIYTDTYVYFKEIFKYLAFDNCRSRHDVLYVSVFKRHYCCLR
jgi:hypothetical protein